MNPEKINILNIATGIGAIILGVFVYYLMRRDSRKRLYAQMGLAMILVGVVLFCWLWLKNGF
ncbi:MAG: hypothetical protein QOH24_2209 [Verrucomicrobiota bacterium]